MNRRDLLTAAPAAGLSALMVGAVEASPASPIMTIFHRIVALEAAAEVYVFDPADGVDEDEAMTNLFWDARSDLEAEMMALPSQSARDFAAKMIVLHMDGHLSGISATQEPIWIEARALVGL